MLNTTPNLINTTTPAASLFEIASSTGILWLDIQAYLLAYDEEIALITEEFASYKTEVVAASQRILQLLDSVMSEEDKVNTIRTVITAITNQVSISKLQKEYDAAVAQLAIAEAKLNEVTSSLLTP
jgi:predicted  nucleic acid-binding Zn-ribbon protein